MTDARSIPGRFAKQSEELFDPIGKEETLVRICLFQSNPSMVFWMCCQVQEVPHQGITDRQNLGWVIVIEQGDIISKLRASVHGPNAVQEREAIQRTSFHNRNDVRLREEPAVISQQELAIVVRQSNADSPFDVRDLFLERQGKAFLAELIVGPLNSFKSIHWIGPRLMAILAAAFVLVPGLWPLPATFFSAI